MLGPSIGGWLGAAPCDGLGVSTASEVAEAIVEPAGVEIDVAA
jgi:hypothetical protein